MKLRPLAGATLLALATLSLPARALTLGEARSLSPLGSALRAEIAIHPQEGAPVDVNCFRLRAPQSGAALPALSGARLALKNGPGGPVLQLSTGHAVGEPILSFVLEDVCGQSKAREYALLLDPPAAGSGNYVEPVQPQAPVAAAQASGEWAMVPGESLDSLADALYPGNGAMQRRFVTAVRRANPALAHADSAAPLAAGMRLKVPRLKQLAASAPRASKAEPSAETRTAAPRAAPAAGALPAKPRPAGGERLKIESAPPEVIQELVARQRAAGVNVVDTTPAKAGSALDGMNRKIGELELIEAQLRVQIAAIDAKIAATRALLAERELARTATVAVAAAPPAASAAVGTPMWATLLLGGLIAMTGVAVGVGSSLALRRRSDAKAAPPPAPEALSAPAATAQAATAAPIITERAKPRAHPDDEAGGIEVSDLNFVLGLHDDADPSRPAVATTTVLARYLEAKGMRTSVPWLALLDGFKAANLRAEYEGLATRVRANYNVQVPSWDEPEADAAAPSPDCAPLEEFPHIVRRIASSWGTQMCTDYLDSLLQDNRNGTRGGFPMAALGDILLLISVIEARRENDGREVARRPAVVTPLRRSA